MNISFQDYDKEKLRGEVCNLCTRRFHINTTFTASFKIIDAQNKALSMTQQQSESFIKSLEKERFEQEELNDRLNVQINTTELESESYQTTVFKYQSEFEQSESDKNYLDERVASRHVMVETLRDEIRELEKGRIMDSDKIYEIDQLITEETRKK